MSKLHTKNVRPLQSGGIGAFLLGIVFCLIFLFFIVATGGKSRVSKENTLDVISKLASAPSGPLQPDGELAEIFKLGSDFTDLQRQIKLKEILGQVVEWRLPVYEVKQSGNGYIIQTSNSFKGDYFGKKLIGTFLYITPRDESDRRLVENLKTGDVVAFKGIINDTTMRNLDINPALLLKDSPPAGSITQTSKVAASPTSVAQSEKVNAPLKAISDNFGDDTFAELLSILANFTVHCPEEGTCKAKEFTFRPIDVNADGKNEFVVTNGDYCGSGGCTTLLMAEASDKTWAPLASTFGSLNVMTVSTRDYRDIQHILKIYPSNGPWYQVAQKFSWSGREYVANGKLEPLP